jgi:hypothetical protein
VIPVWVGAGSEIPACLASKDKKLAPANELAMELKEVVFPVTRGNGNKYLDYLTLRRDILPEVEKAEAEEIAAGEDVKGRFAKSGFDIELVKKFNAGADERFEAFRNRMKKIIEK